LTIQPSDGASFHRAALLTSSTAGRYQMLFHMGPNLFKQSLLVALYSLASVLILK
jgi:hypothetical protein